MLKKINKILSFFFFFYTNIIGIIIESIIVVET